VNDFRLLGYSIPTFVVLAIALTACDLSGPTAPGGLTANAQSVTVITLTWTAAQVPANGSGLTGYSLERKTDASAFVPVATPKVDSTTFSDTALIPSTTYTYRLRAGNAFNWSPYSNEASATTIKP
jgi:Fibronectin type III domain